MAKRETIAEQAHKHYEPGVPFEIPIPTESVYHLLEDAAKRYPNTAALDYFGKTITYAEVLDQAERGAQVLTDLGVERGDVVALSLPICPQAFVAFYACQRIGAVAAQHNPMAPADEIAGQVTRHKAKVAIAWEGSVAHLPIGGDSTLETVLSVDITAHMPAKNRILLTLPVKAARKQRASLRSPVPSSALSWDRAVREASPLPAHYPHAKVDDIAVILHTGGTNGVPKSVPLSHRNLGANVDQCLFWVFKLHEGAEVFFSLLPYFHAFGLTFFLLASVKKAATQVVLPKFDVDLALEAHRRRPVTFFVGVPPMFERIARERWKPTLTSLRSVSQSPAPCLLAKRLRTSGSRPRTASFWRATDSLRPPLLSPVLPSATTVASAPWACRSLPHRCAWSTSTTPPRT